METLASIFVTVVTLAGALFPRIDTNRILALETKASPPPGEVLSSSDSLALGLPILGSPLPSGNEEVERERLRERLQTIKNERKREIVERIAENLTKLNTKWVNQWDKDLERLSTILEKIGKRTDGIQANGQDVSDVEESIAAAKAKILSAQAAVQVQSQKTYPITISTEKNLGQDVRAVINQFHNDIKTVREEVKAAKEAVVAAFQAAAKVMGEKNEEE